MRNKFKVGDVVLFKDPFHKDIMIGTILQIPNHGNPVSRLLFKIGIDTGFINRFYEFKGNNGIYLSFDDPIKKLDNKFFKRMYEINEK